ncbi:MAG: FkbM family methyltransferase [Bacteroidota bacterium]|nr:FkbM family methyltransferase [bacterium]MBU1874761.1 FkbM family methyltransferase [bacterium]
MNAKKLIFNIIHCFLPTLLYKKASYSQGGEDMILASFYDGKKGYKGFYVDVGAHHPFRFSNTAFFYRKGWKGINIEPTPSLFKAFHRFRKRDFNLKLAVGNGAPAVFNIYNDDALNTFSNELVADRKKRVGDKYYVIDKIEIPTFPLSHILDKYLPKDQKIDILSVDVEGLDLFVLKSNDWDRFRPDFIIVECQMSIDESAQNELYQYLHSKGYIVFGITRLNCIFMNKNLV